MLPFVEEYYKLIIIQLSDLVLFTISVFECHLNMLRLCLVTITIVVIFNAKVNFPHKSLSSY
jgi:hypothetical protein